VPQLVPRSELLQAIALNSVGINVSRAIGPAVGGFVIAVVGLWAPFLLNAISFAFVIGVLIWWKAGSGEARALPAERFTGAIRTGLRYTRESGPVRNTLYRAIGFFCSRQPIGRFYRLLLGISSKADHPIMDLCWAASALERYLLPLVSPASKKCWVPIRWLPLAQRVRRLY
jgi:MFS family permease